MNDVQQKWTHKFHIDDKTTEPTVFKFFSKCYNQLQHRDDINDVLNDERINERAIHINKDLNYELQKEKDKRDDLCNENKSLESKLSILLDEIHTMKERKHTDYESIHEQYDKVTKQLRQEDKDQLREMSNKNDKQNEMIAQLNERLNETIISYSENKKNKSSHAIGVEGEGKLHDTLESGFEIESTASTSHTGDIVIRYMNKKFICDSKNYQTTVPKGEVIKLIEDVASNGYAGGIIVSLNSYVIDPNTRTRTTDKMKFIKYGGIPLLLLSVVSGYLSELNAIIKLFLDGNKSISETNTQLNITCLLDYIENELIEIGKERKHVRGEEKKMVENIKSRLHELHRREQDLITMKNKYLNDTVEDTSYISDNIVHVDEQLTTIDDLINQHATKHSDKKGQRNSTHDISQYFGHYCTKHNHTLNKVNRKQLNDILLSLGYQSEKKHGKNYQNKIRKKDSPTWPITLSPDLLN